MRVKCDTDEYTRITSYATAMLVALPLGMTFAMHMILRANRQAIEARQTRTGDDKLEHLAIW